MSNRVSAALALRRIGWNVVAAPHKGKTPVGSWKRWQTELVPERDIRQAFAIGEPNLFVITGSVSQLVVLDCDDQVAVDWWRDKLGDALDKTTASRSGRADAEGFHFYFRLKPGQIEKARSSDGGESGKWSLQAEGKGVVAPPSIHASGKAYEWLEGRGPEALQSAPKELFERPSEGGSGGGDGGTRSMLSHLLANPEKEGGRNNWLTKVAGHYAKLIPYNDAYEGMVRDAAAKLDPPLDEEEIEKTIQSVWSAEQSKLQGMDPIEGVEDEWREHVATPTEETGWLCSGGNRILCQVLKSKDKDGNREPGLASWLDADIRVLGVVATEEQRVYEVEVRRPNGDVTERQLPSNTLSDLRALNVWLGKAGASIGPPDNIYPKGIPSAARMTRYLEAQGAPALVAVPALGWDEQSQAFITHEGVITEGGSADYAEVRPTLDLRNWAPYRYGFSGEEEARAVLREVLEFHHPEVAAVFGAWWAACLLKPQITPFVSQFPFMALEATSESGKTTGYFSLMLQLSGNRGGQSNPTRAALRDYLSAHRSGIVWVDDLDDLEDHGELLRNVTVGGSLIKKGEGNREQVVAVMRSALVVSGEGLGLRGQKALADRAVLLDVPSPTSRRNRAGDGPQWDDILDLRERYPDLTVFAGDIVRLALSHVSMVREVKSLKAGTGRFADKTALVRLGARLLHSIAGEGTEWVVEEVDGWARRSMDYGSENTLTLEMIPRALSSTGWKKRPEGPDPVRNQPATPTFVDNDGVVWFSPGLLAQWWERNAPRRANLRTESVDALIQQARAMGLGGADGAGRKKFKFVTNDGNQRYWRCPPDLSALVIYRSEGGDREEQLSESNGQLFGD